MKTINELFNPSKHPVRMAQFGEGNFLRAFVDYMVDAANKTGVMDCGIAIVKPIAAGSLEAFHRQHNLYTVSLRGSEKGVPIVENEVITSIQNVYDCYTEYETYMKLAELDTLEFVVSNTTEAGIVLDEADSFEACPPRTYPGKLTQFLWRRYNTFFGDSSKGLIIIPVELIERNGEKLKECVLRLAEVWNLEEGFSAWVKSACIFCSTLVDRIVTGYPKGEDGAEQLWKELGYRDDLVDTAEPFGLWVIESERDISDRLPLDKAGQPVLFTADQRPYRERKVRILNGAHTSTVPAAFLAGKDIVREAMKDPLIRCLMTKVVFNEIVPTVPLPKEEAEAFANKVFERFENPFVDHALLSITLNSVSKWKARILPSFRDSFQKNGEIPPLLTFSFAALLAFYSNGELKDGKWMGRHGDEWYEILDDQSVLDFFKENKEASTEKLTDLAAARVDFWGEDLRGYPEFTAKVNDHLRIIREQGMEAAMRSVLTEEKV